MVPIIVITARPDAYPVAMDTGVAALMQKPLDIPLLLEAMRELLAGPATKRLSRRGPRTANAEDLMNQENAFPLGDTPADDPRSIVIELEAHDVSRFEWCVAVPLPAHEPLKYTVQAKFELPSVSISSRAPWDQLQGFTRLEEPEMVSASGDNATVNLLRQQVPVLQQMLQRARQGVLRHCRLVCEQPGDEAAVESLIYVAEHGVQGPGNCSRASGGEQGQRFCRDCARARTSRRVYQRTIDRLRGRCRGNGG